MAIVLIGIGSNQGDRESFINQSMVLMEEIPETSIRKKSDFKEYPAQEICEGQPPFLNGVVQIETDLLPLDLLHKLQVIERKLGRASKGDGEARPIDLDILSYNDSMFQGKNLIIPHPKMHERIFVMDPLAQILPEWNHPKINQTASEILLQISGANANYQVNSSPNQDTPDLLAK